MEGGRRRIRTVATLIGAAGSEGTKITGARAVPPTHAIVEAAPPAAALLSTVTQCAQKSRDSLLGAPSSVKNSLTL